jgi:hypothetical protein
VAEHHQQRHRFFQLRESVLTDSVGAAVVELLLLLQDTRDLLAVEMVAHKQRVLTQD